MYRNEANEMQTKIERQITNVRQFLIEVQPVQVPNRPQIGRQDEQGDIGDEETARRKNGDSRKQKSRHKRQRQ